jgi:hypothetical protein
MICVSSNETQTTQSANPQNKLLLGTVPESSSTLPLRSIRIDVNLVGLLARVSSNRSCLPNTFLRQWRIRFASPRLQWRGPLRICTGFPCNTKFFELYGTLQNSVKPSNSRQTGK